MPICSVHVFVVGTITAAAAMALFAMVDGIDMIMLHWC